MSTKQQLTHLCLRLSPLPSVFSLHMIKEPSTLQGSAQLSSPRELTSNHAPCHPLKLSHPSAFVMLKRQSQTREHVSRGARENTPHKGREFQDPRLTCGLLLKADGPACPHTASRTGPSPPRGSRKAAPGVPRHRAALPRADTPAARLRVAVCPTVSFRLRPRRSLRK